MVTSKIRLQDFVEHGLMRILEDPGSMVKVLVDLVTDEKAM